jgi:alkylation response protein AidB-like acyl-CoA dehydrogenase
MTVRLTEEQQDFVSAIRDFAKRECGTREQRDALTKGGNDQHNVELYGRLADLGWLGAAIEEPYGGSGGGVVDLCLLLEESSRGRLPVRFISVSMICAGLYQRFGSETQKHDVLRSIVEGSVVSIAMSEPEAGSDVGNLNCHARPVPGGYVVNGQKTWTTGAHKASRICVVCRTERGIGKHQGLTILGVPADADGMKIRGIETLGDREVNDIYFTDCFVSADNVVGTVGGGWPQLMAGLNHERLIVGAFSLGVAQRAFDDALQYVKERHQFGHPIGAFQAIRHRLADLATELECCRRLLYSVAAQVDSDPATLLPREASMVKLKVTETARRIALEGMQMMGGYGYAREYDMATDVVQTLPMTIYGGTSEVQRDIIAKSFGLRGA